MVKMGINLFSDYQDPPNPNPMKWKTISKEKIGDYIIQEVKYHGCTTFNGHKLVLMRKEPLFGELDPHLLGTHHYVMARFEPTEEGWALARLCAENLNEES